MSTIETMATPGDFAATLAKRQHLDPAVPLALRCEAVALQLAKAGAAVNPSTRSARSVLKALATIESLAALSEGSVQRLWLAIRALGLSPGEHLGGSLAADPVILALARIGQIVPTLDLDDRIGGAIGSLEGRSAATFVVGARSVDPAIAEKYFEVRDGDRVLWTESTRLDSEDLLQAIDTLPPRRTRTATAPASAVARTAQPTELDYMAIEPKARDPLAGESLFDIYAPARMSIPGVMAHPSPLVESSALASVLPPVPTYRPLLPPELVSKGVLSDVQIETVVYAGQAHEAYLPSDPMDPNGVPPRQGFLNGHGTGVGKTRPNLAVILDNWMRGRRRHVVISERQRLHKDLAREWAALGGKASDIIPLRDVAPADQIPARNGILFLSYSLLRGEQENTKRVDQIIDWLGAGFDGVINLDECQNLRNAKLRLNKFGTAKASKQGEAAVKLQQALPHARLVYSSATSASDIASLGYAIRLGLWGKGTAFPNAESFFGQMEAGGINALELVARDLKALGLYMATNLSFDGVLYERLEHRLTPEERHIQDACAEAWAEINVALQQAILSTGVAMMAKNAGRAVCALRRAQFGMAKARFFQALHASFGTKPLIEAIRKDIAAGQAPVVQLTNTYEANAERAIAEAAGDLSEVEATPKDILVEYIRNQFPTQRYSVARTGKRLTAVPLLNSQGAPVVDTKAEAARDALILSVQRLDMPEGPLEQILEAFGSQAVAEVTGRSRRLVPGLTPGERRIEDRSPALVDEDIRMFQAGMKRLLVFSTSGAAGSSYDASRACQNQALRRHYLLQPGWRADLAVQGLGRTHRSNQVQPPVYILITLDLWSNRRMISTVASGMQRLGAITRGQRHAATQELFTDDDNLESALASDAWAKFLKDLEGDNIPNMSLAGFERDTGIPLREPITGRLVEPLPEVRRFLNSMYGMSCAQQEIFGSAYKSRLDEVRIQAIRTGTFDRGIETLTAESLIKLDDNVIYRDPGTGAATRLVRMLRRDPCTRTEYREAMRVAIRAGNATFVKNALTGRVACIAFPKVSTARGDDKVTVITPNGVKQRTRNDVAKERWILSNAREAEELWAAESALPPEEEETVITVVAGTLLPIWDKMPKDRPRVYRMETDEGERILGRVLPDGWADKLVTRVNAMAGNAVDPHEALAGLAKGNICTLDNGWTVEGRVYRATGQSRIEIYVNDKDPDQFTADLAADGVEIFHCPFAKKPRFTLPADTRLREKAWLAMTRFRKVVGITSLFA